MKTRYALAVAVILIVVFELTLVKSGAQWGGIRTGTYNGTGANVTIQTGLTTTRAFFVTELSPRGPSAQGYTTDTIQTVARGSFLNGSRTDTGIAFETPTTVVISNRDFIASGAQYHWEARGE